MAKPKIEDFSDNQVELAAFFKALAHPARIAILQYLSNSNSCITGNIASSLPLSRTTVNQHLEILKSLNLIKGHIAGVNTKYCINPEKIADFSVELTQFLETLKTINYECE